MCGTSHTSSAEPVSRTTSRKVGLDRFNLTIPRHKKNTNKRLATENINARNNHVAFYSWNTSTHRSSSDTTEGFRGIVNQNFLRMRTEGKPRSNLGDANNERDWIRSSYPWRFAQRNVRRNVGDVVVLASPPRDPIRSSTTSGGASVRCTRAAPRRLLLPRSSKYGGEMDWIYNTTAWCIWWRISAAGLRLQTVGRERGVQQGN